MAEGVPDAEQSPTAGVTGATGAAGGQPNTGVAGATVAQVVYPDPSKQRVWNETKQGAGLSGGYESLRTAFAKTMPGQREEIQRLARRKIGG
jgi:hypothetical protein